MKEWTRFRIRLFPGVLLLLLGCCGRGPGTVEPLTQRFDDFPVLRRQARFEFTREDFSASAGPGWALPGGRPENPYWIAVGATAGMRVLLDPAADLTMRLLCRVGRETCLTIKINGAILTRKVLRPGRNTLTSPLTGVEVKPGLNLLTFQFSPEPRIRGREARIVFRRLEFLPGPGEAIPEIRVDSREDTVRLRGGLASRMLVRTGLRPRFRMEVRSFGKAQPPARLNLRFEDDRGNHLKESVIISGEKWESKSVDLFKFEDRTVKITFQHDAGPETVSELRFPHLSFSSRSTRPPRVLLIGLDGATWEVMKPLLSEGRLPNIARLLREGVGAPLRTVRPWYSPVVWTSIVTGKTMDKHGITGFLQQRRDHDRQLPNSRLNRKCLAIWNILNQAGYTTGLIGPWVSWPAESLDGYVLTDRIDFRNLNSTAYPSDLKGLFFNKLQPEAERSPPAAYGDLTTPLDPRTPPRSPVAANLREASLYYRQDLWKSRAGLELDRIFSPDFTFLYLRGPDVTGHFFWKYHEPDASVPASETALFGDMLRRNYIFQDAVIGEYLRHFGSRTLVMIVSDHGMGRKSYTPDLGFERVGQLWKDMGLSRAIAASIPVAHGLRLRLTQGTDPERVQTRLLQLLAGPRRVPLFSIQAEPAGDTLRLSVSPGIEVDDHLELHTGGRLLKPLNAYTSSREISGDHTLDGVLILHGPGIRTGIRLTEASILDITPSLLHYMGIPIGKDMDGRVLVQAFSAPFMRSHPIRSISTHETGGEGNPGKEIDSDSHAQNEELLRRLRSLGYIR